MAIFIPFGNILSKNAPVIMLRLAGPSGSYIVQADVSSIQYQIWDVILKAKVLDTTTLVVATTIYNSPINDDLWNDFDEIGYNFKHAFLDASAIFTNANGVYRIDYKLVMATAAVYRAAVEVKSYPVYMDV